MGESRLPPALALVAFLGLNVALRVWLPHGGAVRAAWLLPSIEVLLAGNPARLAPRAPWLRPHLGFTDATAFSPTDVMPLTHKAKYTMVVQLTVALALFGLIVARAVNAFT